MDYKQQIRELKSSFGLYCIKEPNAADKMIDAAQSITDLLARAEAAEARVRDLEKLLSAVQNMEKFYPDKTGFFVFTKKEADDITRKLVAAEARAEKAERERDSAVSDLETIMAYNSDTCQFCKNGQCYVRGGTKSCPPKWRGQKEE